MKKKYTFAELVKKPFSELSKIGQELIEELAIIEMKRYQKVNYILFLQDKIESSELKEDK